MSNERQNKRPKRNAEYWKARFGQVEQAQHERGVEAFNKISEQYRQAEKDIQAKIDAWYRRFAKNNGITLAEARQMLNAKELAEFQWDVNDYIKHGRENAVSGEWVKELENASARAHISRLEALKIQCQQGVEVLFGSQTDVFDTAMRDIYREGYYHNAFTLQKGFGVGWDFALLDEKRIDRVINTPWAVDGLNFSERLWGNKEKLIGEIDKTLTQNIIRGEDPQKAIDDISERLNVSKSQAGRLVMTEEAYFGSAAQQECFKELDVEEYEIVATLDNITSEICQEMDGKVFKMSEWEVGVTAPPFHPWCRTTTVPAFDDDFDDPGERAARGADGKTYYVPDDMKYPEWKNAFVDGESMDGLEPAKVETPTQSGVSVQFVAPAQSEKSAQSEKPKQSGTPAQSEKPTSPMTAASSEKVTGPASPVLSGKTENPVNSIQTEKSGKPEKPPRIANKVEEGSKEKVVANIADDAIIKAKGENHLPSDKYDMPRAKIESFLLNPKAKHSKEFFDVGYAESDVEKLNQDIYAQFEEDKKVGIVPTEHGVEKFSIFMELGVTEKKRFRTVWMRDTKESKPRFITAYREGD